MAAFTFTPFPKIHQSLLLSYRDATRFPSLFLGSLNPTVVPKYVSRAPGILSPPKAFSSTDLLGFQENVLDFLRASPATWNSSIASNLLIFTLGSPVLFTGLSELGMSSAFLLGILTWRAFEATGFLLVATYFVVGTAVTKLKISQKEALGVAEKRMGRRGPGSVIGSSAAACACALLSIYNVGGSAYSEIWRLAFVASFCTKLSDTVSSEIGKAYGSTTYLVTTLKVVPRGTEGAVSVEGTFAGFLASVFLAAAGYFMGEVDASEAAICVLASQLANLGESFIGALFQEKAGFQWVLNSTLFVLYFGPLWVSGPWCQYLPSLNIKPVFHVIGRAWSRIRYSWSGLLKKV